MELFESIETESDSCLYYSKDNINKTEKQNRLMKSPKPKYLSISYISEEDCNRCWFFFSDIILCKNPYSDFLADYKMVKGNNTFKIGNEFSCYWLNLTKIHYKCIESKNDDFIKRISWIISIDLGFKIRKQYIIYPITNNNKSLIKEVLELVQPNNGESLSFKDNIDYYNQIHNSIMKYKAKFMNESKKYRFIHESFIAKNDFETTWQKIVNFQMLADVTSGKIGENFVCNGDPEKKGTFWKCHLNNNDKSIYFRVKNVIKSKKRNKWVYHLETIGAGINIIKQEIEISVTKINKNSNLISVLIIFNDKINKNLYDSKKKNLTKTMKKIKLFINKD